MRDFLSRLAEHNYRNKTIALIENGTWAPVAAKTMRGLLEDCKNITWAENNVTIRSALTDENRAQIEALARELL